MLYYSIFLHDVGRGLHWRGTRAAGLTAVYRLLSDCLYSRLAPSSQLVGALPRAGSDDRNPNGSKPLAFPLLRGISESLPFHCNNNRRKIMKSFALVGYSPGYLRGGCPPLPRPQDLAEFFSLFELATPPAFQAKHTPKRKLVSTFNAVWLTLYACGRSVPPTLKEGGGVAVETTAADPLPRPINRQRAVSCRPLVCLCHTSAARQEKLGARKKGGHTLSLLPASDQTKLRTAVGPMTTNG